MDWFISAAVRLRLKIPHTLQRSNIRLDYKSVSFFDPNICNRWRVIHHIVSVFDRGQRCIQQYILFMMVLDLLCKLLSKSFVFLFQLVDERVLQIKLQSYIFIERTRTIGNIWRFFSILIYICFDTSIVVLKTLMAYSFYGILNMFNQSEIIKSFDFDLECFVASHCHHSHVQMH